MEEERRWKEEEKRNQLELESQKQSEMEGRWGAGETEGDPVAEVERKGEMGARICEQWTAEQMTRVAQVESSK